MVFKSQLFSLTGVEPERQKVRAHRAPRARGFPLGI
jgi:hypothetical protein